jgi:GntR family transcriptional regulator
VGTGDQDAPGRPVGPIASTSDAVTRKIVSHRLPRDRRPLSVQVADELRAAIAEGAMRPGDQLPSEMELSKEFEVARTTVREALRTLEIEGLVELRQRRGRFVAAVPRLERPITRYESVTEMMGTLGYRVSNKVLSVQVDIASNEEAEALGLAAGSSVIRLERVRSQDDDPLIYSIDTMPREVVAEEIDAVDWTGSLLDVLEANGCRPVSSAARIRAATLPRSIAQRLEIDPRTPWLLMTQICMTETGRLVIYSYDYHRGDSVAFDVVRRRE